MKNNAAAMQEATTIATWLSSLDYTSQATADLLEAKLFQYSGNREVFPPEVEEAFRNVLQALRIGHDALRKARLLFDNPNV